MSAAGWTFALEPEPDPGSVATVTAGWRFELEADETPSDTFTASAGWRFSLGAEGVPDPSTLVAGWRFALAAEITGSITIRKHPTSGALVTMPLLHMIGGQLVDTVTGEPWTP